MENEVDDHFIMTVRKVGRICLASTFGIALSLLMSAGIAFLWSK